MLQNAQLAIDLPLSHLDDATLRAPTDLPQALHRRAATVPPKLILVIDDHPDSRTIGRLLLESAGYGVIEACTGPDGLQRGARISSLRRAARHRAARTRWVARGATAALGRDDASHGAHRDDGAGRRARCDAVLPVGFDEVLIKPVPPIQLLTTVQRYVGRVEARQVVDR